MIEQMQGAVVGSELRTETVFADFIERLHRRLGGDAAAVESLRSTAVALLQAARRGDSCLAMQSSLPDSPVIGTANDPSLPWVQDIGHLYLQRLWLAETELAARLLRLNAKASDASGQMPVQMPGLPPVQADQPTAANIDAELERLRRELAPAAEQLQAIDVGLRRRLLLLTGGPGTGKTFTLSRLIESYRRLHPGARIALAAPTGKAASRLAQALAAGPPAKQAPAQSAPAQPDLPALRVQTVHSLLGMRRAGHRPRHGPHNPLPYDLVVVDESSMLGLELASQLIQSLADDARLILAGDSDQLASVEPGSVFADLIRAGSADLAGSVVRLTKNFRQSEAPELAAFSRALQERDELPPFESRDTSRASPADLVHAAASVFTRLAAARGPAHAGGAEESPEARLQRLLQYRVLSALRAGPWGSEQLSMQIDEQVRERLGGGMRDLWYDGRLVMLTRNLRAVGRVNGDIGLCYRRGDRFWVVFEDANGEAVSVPVTQLAGAEPAWCLTVHKSQGSEFDQVDLVLAPRDSPLARRELVYTGATRARKSLRIWCDPRAIESAALTSVERRGTLARRLGCPD